ncbi:MAG: cytochrome c peroxidase [Paraglaciecola sp.]|jgi:cytochrome c peroxidase
MPMKKQPCYLLLLMLATVFSCRSEKIDVSDPNNITLTNLPHSPTNYELNKPEFFDSMPIPVDNIMTEEGVELGRYLFYDSILSQDGQTECATCHQLENSFSNQNALATGGNGQLNSRSTMTLANVGYVETSYFWDGHASTLETATLSELTNPDAMNGVAADFLAKIRNDADYRKRFRAAFPIENTNEIDANLVSKALAQFQRTFITANSRLDRAQSTNSNGFELTDLEVDGYFLFFREQNFTLHPGCSHCHGATYFQGDTYYNNGLDEVDDLNNFPDLGRGGVTGIYADNGTFRAPTLRNIETTAPYMHDGRFGTLEEVLNHYQSGGHPADNLDQEITGFPLTDYEKESLLAFLKSLTDPDFLDNSDFKSPF